MASFTPLLSFLILLVPVIALSVYPALAAGQVSGRAELVSHSYFIGYLKLEAADETIEGNFYNIVGLVENTGTVSIEHVSIIPTLYDAKGEVIVVSSEIFHLWCPERLENDTRRPVNLIAPGERLPLKVTILDEEAGRRIASYDLSIDFDETTREPYGDVQVLGTNLYVDEWYAYLTGEMKNVGTKNTYYDVFFALYDETGRIVDAGYYAGLTSILVPEQKSPFEIQVWPLHDITPPIRIESYELFPQCMETTVESYEEFEVLSHRSYVGSYPPIIERGMIVEGEIKNVGSRDATGVGVIATFYDAEGRVVGVSHDGWMVDRNLRAGEVDSFKLVPMTGEEWYGKVASYILQVTCHEYVLPSSISCGVSRPEVILGEQVVVSGSTSFRRGGVTVTLRYVKPDGSTLTRSVATSEDGSYVDAYAPDVLGEWGVEASWGGDEYNLGATSQSLVFNVEVSDLVEKKEVQKGLVVRQVPPPEIVSASIVAGAGVAVGVPALMSFRGFARHLDSVALRLKIPSWLRDFLKFHAEETFKVLTKEEIEATERKGVAAKKGLLSLTVSGIVLLIVFGYVEVGGLPNFLNIPLLLEVIPSILGSVVLLFIVTESFSMIVARTLKVRSEFRIWLYGLIALLVSGILFLVPFAGPGRVSYQGKLGRRKVGAIALLKIICLFIPALPFYIFHAMGLATVADAGLLTATMLACYSSFPIKPLEGEAVFRLNKGLWLALFTVSFALFLNAVFNILPRIVYFLCGLAAIALFAFLLSISRRFEESPELVSPPPI